MIELLIALAMGVFVAFYLGNLIAMPLKAAVAQAKMIAGGELSGPALESKGNDEVAELTVTVQEVSRNVSETANAAQEASAGTNEGRVMIEGAIESICLLASSVEGAAGVIP